MKFRNLAYGVSAAAIMMTASTAVYAQETTGSIRGYVAGRDGTPVANASVVVVHQPSGTRSVAVTNEAGAYTARGLRVGGPYSVEVTANGETAAQDVAGIGIGEAYDLDLQLGASASTVEDVIVTGSRTASATAAIGPSAVFTQEMLSTAPTVNRDIRDVIAMDPRIHLDAGFQNGVQCGGANPRFNSLTVDGVRLNDNFGLNDSGYPTERMPFSFDSIEQVAVELAPFGAQYGRFTSCNINAVTKSGGNAFHGGAFYDFTNQDLNGDKLEGQDIDLGEFEEKRWGVYLGGPIIKDTLFFFGSYEKLEGTNVFSRGPADGGFGTPVLGLSTAQYNEIVDIAQDVYGFDPGGIPTPATNEDEKILIKLDWNINDRHRASFTYNHNEGFNVVESDSASNNFEFSDHLYRRGSELDAYVVQLFSDWTDNFSTEFRVAYSELATSVIPQGGYDIGELRIRTSFDGDGNPATAPSSATVFLGADDSRHSNSLTYDTLSVKAGGAYTYGDHLFTFGFEREELDVYNLFVQHTLGEFYFDSIADFRNGLVTDVDYGNAASLNPSDAAGQFKYATNTLYAQDEFRLTDALTVTAGVRYDWYETDDAPAFNANFLARNGFANTHTLDGVHLLQPRIGFTYEASPALTFRGGVGLYSGGNPNVWISNNFSNDGITNIQVDLAGLGTSATNKYNLFANNPTDPLGIPPVLVDRVENFTPNSAVNALDPAFQAPSAWKFALGTTWYVDAPLLGDGLRLDGDLLYSDTQDAAIVKDLSLVQTGTAPDGRPIYRRVDKSDPDCAINPAGAACASRGSNNDFLLTNTNGGYQFVASANASQSYDWGFDWALGYAYTEAEDVTPMSSSVAFSNYSNFGASDLNNPGVATSGYETKHRITLRLNYEKAFFGDYDTRFTLFGRYSQTRPFTYSFTSDDGTVFGDGVNNVHLLYIPTGPTDPLVTYAAGFDQTAFFNFLESSGLNEYAGQILPRNSQEGSWWGKVDLRIEQELPGFAPGHKSSAFVVVDNLTNLIDDEWGVLKEATFPQIDDIVDVGIVGNQYQYQRFFTPGATGRVTRPSLWSVRVGLRYTF